jgi:3-deoxy-7-phosphoheptulonate synthase
LKGRGLPALKPSPYTVALTNRLITSDLMPPLAMLLRLHPTLTPSQVGSVLRVCAGLGYATKFLGDSQQWLELEGTPAPAHRTRIEDMPGVEFVDRQGTVELHSIAAVPEPRALQVGDASFGAGDVALIAGPCAIEDYDLLEDIARGVRQRGATLLRGGAYKPRTSPYSFQGLGRQGLEFLSRVRAETGIGIVTEVLDPRDVEAVGEVADMFQIGARSMTNFALLQEVGQTRTPVLLKRGFGATLREFLMAAEYVLAGGNESVLLCERGVRGFDNVTRNLLDVGAVAYLKQTTHLPVIVDPSHAAGRSDLVPALARAGIAAGADGLMVEVHPAPFAARSDGQQAISFEVLDQVVSDVSALCGLDGRKLIRPQVATAGNGPFEESMA